MKTLDTKSSEILRALLALQTNKIDNSDGTFMPVHIEIVNRTPKYNSISLAHYGEQNGDLMRDPEMLFLLMFDTQQFIPYYFRNDYCGVEEYSFIPTQDGAKYFNPALQVQHAKFANQWLRNIAEQQGIR